MKTKIKYGIVGSGLMGCEHISNINLIDSAEVVAISDSNENSINKAKNLISNDIKIYSNNNEIFKNNEVDAFIISTPNFTHHDIIKEALKTTDTDAIRNKIKDLTESAMKLGEAVYKEQQEQKPTEEKPKDDNVVDADFEEVKKDK